jgi:hypothetical protein
VALQIDHHLVGRAEELSLLGRVLAELDQGRSEAILLVGEHRQDASPHGARRSRGCPRTPRPLGLGLRARARLALLGFRRRNRRVTARARPNRFAVLDDDLRTELAHVFPSLTTLANGRHGPPARALSQPPCRPLTARATRVGAAARPRARRPPQLGNTHALMWTLLSRSAGALRRGDVELALATAQESVDLSRHADSNFHSAEAAADLAAALLETGQPERAVELLLESAGGDELVLIAGSPRARYLEVLARSWLDLGRHAEAKRAAAAAQTWAVAVQLPMASAWADRAAAAVELYTGEPARAAGRHSHPPRPPMRPGRRSRQPCLARCRASHSRKPGSVTAPRPSCNARPATSRNAERSATGIRRNASCASSAIASTTARGREAPTGLGLNR